MTVVRCNELLSGALADLLVRFGLELQWVAASQRIPGTFWGEPEAGLIADTLFVRPDTPVHSAVHEACHYICMGPIRRTRLHTNAGGTLLEECAVCYLQIILADYLPGFGRDRALSDMDAWGYSFRLGSAKRWFEEDASDACDWLLKNQIITFNQQPTWRLSGETIEVMA